MPGKQPYPPLSSVAERMETVKHIFLEMEKDSSFLCHLVLRASTSLSPHSSIFPHYRITSTVQCQFVKNTKLKSSINYNLKPLNNRIIFIEYSNECTTHYTTTYQGSAFAIS